ncbi:MAG TPA: SagB family peptide dehydrogenase [Pseudonocardiaceae bacterium]|nr:SagB family peptide dehydrogenase [Pseudonocardiaceae bacterium]
MSKESAGQTAGCVELWSLREDVLVEDDQEGNRLVVVSRWGETGVDGADDAVRESLRRMSLGPISLQNVWVGGQPPSRRALRPTDEGANVHRVLDLLSGSVVRSLGLSDDGLLLSAVPITRHASLSVARIGPDLPLRLSRFAAMRADQGELLVESPLSQYHVVLHQQLACQLATALRAVTSVDKLAGTLHLDPPVVAGVVAYLAATGIVLVGEWLSTQKARFAEDTDPTLLRWSHHELLFHSRSRMGRYGGQSGAVFPHADELPSPELVKPVREGRGFPLYRPTMAELLASDPRLTEVIEHGGLGAEPTDRQLTAEQVGELLFRAARIRSVSSESAGTDVSYDTSDRPYLSTYGLYELELYVSVHNCVGLPRGMYHYDPQRHQLTLINDSVAELDELMAGARVAAKTTLQPPLLITMTARVARSSWMFGGIGYYLTLTHIGALQQMLCLVANAMGLAATALAVDPGDVTDSTLRLDWPAEVGVGELIVG